MKKAALKFVPVLIILGLIMFTNTNITLKSFNLNWVDDLSSFASSIMDTQELEKDEVTVNYVVDGDTVNVTLPNGSKESVRLLLIDTPESKHPNKPKQPYGEEASEFAKETLSEGQTVTLEKGDPERDKYDRLLGYIWIDDNTNFNQLMIEEGFARVAYIQEPNTKYLEQFKEAEKQAENEGRNIWSIEGYAENEFEEY